MRVASYVALGVGVVGVGIGTVFGLKTRSKTKEADDLAAQCGSDCRTTDPQAPQIVELDDQAHSAKTVSVIGFVVGGVGIATGVTLFVLSNRKSSKTEGAQVRVSPFVGPRMAGLTGTF
jgi:hypothetical protein